MRQEHERGTRTGNELHVPSRPQSLLLDANLPPSIVATLTTVGIVAVHLNELGLADASDERIVECARKTGAVIVTHDLDFGRLLVRSGQKAPSVIVVRLRIPTRSALVAAIEAALTLAVSDLQSGAVVTVAEGTMRMRQLSAAGAL